MKSSKLNNVTDGSFQASTQKDYYLPIPQGNMSGYVAKMLQCYHHSLQTYNIFHLSLYFMLLPFLIY